MSFEMFPILLKTFENAVKHAEAGTRFRRHGRGLATELCCGTERQTQRSAVAERRMSQRAAGVRCGRHTCHDLSDFTLYQASRDRVSLAPAIFN